MEVVSTSCVVSSENEKTIACNFQTMTMNTFVIHIVWWEAKWEAMHICKHEAIHSFMMAELRKRSLKIAKSKPTSNNLKEKICFTLKMHYFLQ